MDPDRVLVGLADAEHPAVPPAAPDRPADLVGERLVGRPARRPAPGRWRSRRSGPSRRIAARNEAIACSNRRSIRSMNPSNGISPVGGQVGRRPGGVAVDRVQEHRGADPLVEVLGPWRNASRSSHARRTSSVDAPAISSPDRAVADRRVGAGDGLDQERFRAGVMAVPVGTISADSDRRRVRRAIGPRSAGRSAPHVAAVLLDPDDRLEQPGEHPLAVDAGQGQGDLGLDDAELDAQVVPGRRGSPGPGTSRGGPGRSARS